MALYYFVIRKLLKKIYMILAIVIIFTITVYVIANCLGLMQQQMYMYKIFNNKILKQSYSVSLGPNKSDLELLESLDILLDDGLINNYWTIKRIKCEIMGESANLYEYDVDLLLEINYPVAMGEWFCEKSDFNVLPCIVGNDFLGKVKIGQEYLLSVNDSAVPVMVIGIMPKKQRILSEEEPWLKYVPRSFKNDSKAILIPDNEAIKDSIGNNYFVFFEEKHRSIVYSALGGLAYITPTNDIFNRYKMSEVSVSLHYFLIALSLSFVASVGLGGFIYLSFELEKKELGLLYALGLTWKMSRWFLMLRGIFILTFSLLFGYINSLIIYWWGKASYIIRPKLYHYIILMGYFFIVYMLSIEITTKKVKNSDPIEIIREGK